MIRNGGKETNFFAFIHALLFLFLNEMLRWWIESFVSFVLTFDMIIIIPVMHLNDDTKSPQELHCILVKITTNCTTCTILLLWVTEWLKVKLIISFPYSTPPLTFVSFSSSFSSAIPSLRHVFGCIIACILFCLCLWCLWWRKEIECLRRHHDTRIESKIRCLFHVMNICWQVNRKNGLTVKTWTTSMWMLLFHTDLHSHISSSL